MAEYQPVREAPYGSWRSPITAEWVAAATLGLDEIRLDGTDVYWLETRPDEAGRTVLVRRTAGGRVADVTPPAAAGSPAGADKPFSVRSRVHEYGGGAYLVADGIVCFSHDGDGRLYRQAGDGGAPLPATPSGRQRYADGILDRARGRMIWVREDHGSDGHRPVNALVEISLDPARPPRPLVAGSDFYSSPRLSPDGARLAWLEWHDPDMPWDATELWVGRIAADGSIGERRRVAGGAGESIFQPEWSPGGRLYFVSDRSGWWNLWRTVGDETGGDETGGDETGSAAVFPTEAECGRAQWRFGMSTFAFESADRLVCAATRGGTTTLVAIDLATLGATPIAADFTEMTSLRAAAGRIYFRGGSPVRPPVIAALDLAGGTTAILRQADAGGFAAATGGLARPQPIAFPTDNGLTAHGLFYAPANPGFTAPQGERPPLIVQCHGGPTSAAATTLDWRIQFWTSRGFAVLDVDYGGSTGYGRAYRERLKGQWGIVDVADCVNGAAHLARTGLVDGRRMAFRGGSAGGFTTLCALAFRNAETVFRAGASYYGVSDLEALARDTHKFEARYLDGLIGPYPAQRDLYRARSPLHAVDRLAVPVAFFQGAEDAVVPPDQSAAMVEALRAKGIPCQYLLFAGEQHGFRRAATIRQALEAELYFYSIFVSGAALAF